MAWKSLDGVDVVDASASCGLEMMRSNQIAGILFATKAMSMHCDNSTGRAYNSDKEKLIQHLLFRVILRSKDAEHDVS